jgi:DnaJ-class molecular chaperone
MGRKDKDEFDDYIQQDLVRGDRSQRAEREPTRTCSNCNGNRTITQSVTSYNSKGKPVTKGERITCPTCGGRGVR